MSWLYTITYLTLIAVFFSQTFYPIFMLLAMFVRQSRLLYSFFHRVDTESKKHGGELVAQVLKSHGVDNIFTLSGGHISPILVACDALKIRVVDVRHEATAVFAADASARLTGIPGVAVVTAGPGLTNTVTAIKNAQLAESPVVVIAGAAATMLKGRGSLQDIDQLSLLKSATKKCFSVDCVREIAPILREALRVSQVSAPGPVLVELPVDILYPYSIIAQQFTNMSPAQKELEQGDKKKKKEPSLKSKLLQLYSEYSLNQIFADAWRDQNYEPLPVSVKSPKQDLVQKAAQLLKASKRPLIILGSQSILKPFGPESVIEVVNSLKIPVYLNGSARGLLSSDHPFQFRHARREAIKEADCILLLGAICDFRLGYGRIFKPDTTVISVNRSLKAARLNSGIFWKPKLTLESDIGRFLIDLHKSLSQLKLEKDNAPLQVDQDWLDTLRKREQKKEESIEFLANEPAPVENHHLNPLKLLLALRKLFMEEDTILVADGGDFVASAAYIMKPNGPMRWLDPGPFGTLGCGAGFALAAKLVHPDRQVVAIMGDGAFGYAIPELDTFVRHKIPVYFLVGNDACWTQIAREQVPMLGSPVGCQLAYTDYHSVAEGFGARGYKLEEDSDLTDKDLLGKAKAELDKDHVTVVVNALISKTKFRDGSISV